MILAGLEARAARLLERGALGHPAFRALGSVWERAVRLERPLRLPNGARVVGVGGATLGGSYKTPLTLALAVALAARGERVAVVGHAYRGLSGPARRIVVNDLASVVGDDALFLSRALEEHAVPVFAGANRADAVRLAARAAPLVVVDALLQSRPERVALSLLAVDAEAPWGAGSCPPAGDLRAARSSLLAATDAVVAVTTRGDCRGSVHPSLTTAGVPLFVAESDLSAASLDGRSRVEVAELRSLRVGLLLAVARPDRIVRDLARIGVVPIATRLFADHVRPRRGSPSEPVDVWVTTEKCATKLARDDEATPIVVLRQRLALPAALLERATFQS